MTNRETETTLPPRWLKTELQRAAATVASWPKWKRDYFRAWREDILEENRRMAEDRRREFRDPNGYCDNPARGY